MEIDPTNKPIDPTQGYTSEESKKKNIKGAEETIHGSQSKNPPSLKGRTTSTDLEKSRLSSELQIEPKDSALWNFKEQKIDPNSGMKVFVFSLKSECNVYKAQKENQDTSVIESNIDKKNQEVYPALEVDPHVMIHMDPKYQNLENLNKFLKHTGSYMDEKSFKENPIWEFGKFLNSLGLKINFNESGEVTLEVPEIKLLMENWVKAEKLYPGLPKLSLALCSGITPDPAFVANYLSYSCTVSTDKELIHDLTAHLIPTMQHMFMGRKDNAYATARSQINENVSDIFNVLTRANNQLIKENSSQLNIQNTKISKTELEVMMTILANSVDVISSLQDLEAFLSIANKNAFMELLVYNAQSSSIIATLCQKQKVYLNEVLSKLKFLIA